MKGSKPNRKETIIRGLHSLTLRLNRENASHYSQHRNEVGEGAEALVQACRALLGVRSMPLRSLKERTTLEADL